MSAHILLLAPLLICAFNYHFQGYYPSNKPGVEPRRPCRPINITPWLHLSTATNRVTITWGNFGKVQCKDIIERNNCSDLKYRTGFWIKVKGRREWKLVEISISCSLLISLAQKHFYINLMERACA